jgi:hypothetical protein
LATWTEASTLFAERHRDPVRHADLSSLTAQWHSGNLPASSIKKHTGTRRQ